MIFNWLDAKEAIQFGVKLAEDLSRELIKLNSKNTKNEFAARQKVIQNVFKQFDQFKSNNNLNFYKKSKLLNEFRWRLAELGHDTEFVDAITKELVIYIN